MTVKITKEQSHLVRLALEGYAVGLSFQPRKRAAKVQGRVEKLIPKFPMLPSPSGLTVR